MPVDTIPLTSCHAGLTQVFNPTLRLVDHLVQDLLPLA